MLNLPHAETPSNMVAKPAAQSLALAALIGSMLAPSPANSAGPSLVRLCAANGSYFISLDLDGRKTPERRNNEGACHSACLGDRPKLARSSRLRRSGRNYDGVP
jgi:hypothetical protein